MSFAICDDRQSQAKLLSRNWGEVSVKISEMLSSPPASNTTDTRARSQNISLFRRPHAERAFVRVRRFAYLLGDLVLGLVLVRRGRAAHVAVDVAAGAEGGAHVLDDCGEHRLQVLLEDAVKLVGLAGGEAQGAVAVLMGSKTARQANTVSIREERSDQMEPCAKEETEKRLPTAKHRPFC
eukprot:8186192-Pyramimonas_sp.AAC.1